MFVMATEAFTKDGGTRKSLLLTVVISFPEKSLYVGREREREKYNIIKFNDTIEFTAVQYIKI